MSVHRSICLVCERFEKGSVGTMVSYLSRRHREKTGHAVSPVVKSHANAEERLPPIRVKFEYQLGKRFGMSGIGKYRTKLHRLRWELGSGRLPEGDYVSAVGELHDDWKTLSESEQRELRTFSQTPANIPPFNAVRERRDA